jgi:hypothetical protein
MANSTASNLLRNTSLASATYLPKSATLSLSNFANAFYVMNYTYLTPVVSLIGFILNSISCGIFLTADFKIRMYRLLFWTSFFHAFALLIQVFEPISQNPEHSPVAGSFIAAVYIMAIRTWIYNALTMTALLCNIAVSFERYIVISRKCKCFCTNIPVYVLVGIFLVFSLACFCFPLIAYYIGPWTSDLGNTYFWVYYSDFGNTLGFDHFKIVMFGLRDCILWIVFVTINVMLLFETRKHFRSRRRLTQGIGHKTGQNKTTSTVQAASNPVQVNQAARNNEQNNAERRITLMVIVMSVVLIFGQVSYFISILFARIVIYAELVVPSAINRIILTTAILSNVVGYSVLFFIFIAFDKNFKRFIMNKCTRRAR